MIPDGEFSPSQNSHKIVTSNSIILVRVRIETRSKCVRPVETFTRLHESRTS